MRGLDKLAFLLMLVMALWAFIGEERDGAPPPRVPPMAELPPPPPLRPPPREAGAALPPPSPRDPVFEVEGGGGGGTSTGSAFSIDPSGLWLTARHVVQGCARIGVRGRRGWTRATVAWAHPGADVALIRTDGGTAPFALAGDAPVRGMDGFGMGFPQGRPGAVQGRLLGRAQMQARGLFKGRAPTLEWAEVRRAPGFRGSLGGISGGPSWWRRSRAAAASPPPPPRRCWRWPAASAPRASPPRALRRWR